VGDRLPHASLFVPGEGGVQPVTTDELFAGRKVVLVGMPGAFTPTCHRNHLPGFVQNAEAIKAKGVDAIAVTSVNDVWVMDAWSKSSNAGDVEFLADGNGDFARAIGLSVESGSTGLGGTRSRRYSMVIEDGVVKTLNVEEAPGKADLSGAENLLKSL